MFRHLGLQIGVGGGTVGVGTFFALSGFLITTLMIEERDATGTLDCVRFWARRALRLLPALAAVLAAVVLWFGIAAHQSYRRAAVLTALYVGNWAQVAGQEFGPLSHTWTLAVEEHFYLLWPVAFLALSRLRIETAVRVTIGLAAGSTILRLALWAAGASPERLQMGTDTRLDGILIGCTAALLLARRQRAVPFSIAALAAGTLVVLTAVQPYSSFMLTAGYVVISLAAVVVILHLVGTTSPLRTALEWAPIVGMGRISYGLYLWHLPVYAVLLPHLLQVPLAVRSVIVMAVSVVVAAASYVLVERSFLRLKAKRWRRPTADRRTSPGQVWARTAAIGSADGRGPTAG